MSETPFVLGRSEGIPAIGQAMQELQESLAFLLGEWQAADKYLVSIGCDSQRVDEYGDVEFVTLEERIKRAVENEQ